MRLWCIKYCYSNIDAIYAKGLCLRKKNPGSAPGLSFVVFQPILDSKAAQEYNFHSYHIIGLFFCFLS